ncbi:RAF-like serine/threonine-protein kinase PRAF [Euphorbia lathyris]|uniref:RAF-like serine/threonine-protein kinase PRAF n=1 Tax=Euphorbia lathyris TaxID=212925 RepID=UPI003313121E
MAALHPPELDSGATDSVASSPRSEHYASQDTRVRFMCSFNGKILPRPHDNQLRYVGGDTRIVAVHRSTTYSAFISKLSKLSGIANLTVKYQLPNEDLDALISVTTDEDIENMIEEYDRILLNLNPRAARLRLFVFAKGEDSNSRASSISSLLDGSTNRENWFFDALNAGSRLERGRSEASSIVSEVPDYLFGLDNSDEVQLHHREPYRMKPRHNHNLHDNISASDPGSPAPVVSSPYNSTSSAVATVPSIPDLPPVKTKLENPEPITHQKQYHPHAVEVVTSEPIEQPAPQPTGYPNPGNPVMHYMPNSHYSGHVPQMPVYYVAGSVPPPSNVPVQQVQIRAPYMQQYPVQTGQMQIGYQQQISGMGQVYGGATMRPVNQMDPYDQSGRGVHEGMNMNQQVYYGVRNAGPRPGMVPGYAGMVMQGGEDLQRTGSDTNSGRMS